MRIQFTSMELSPLVQSGGLGDAVSGLARALSARGHHVTCVVPGVRELLRSAHCPPLTDAGPVHVDVPGRRISGRWLIGELFSETTSATSSSASPSSVRLAVLDFPSLFDRHGLYGDAAGVFGDNVLRFVALSKASAYRAEQDGADVVVAHDHHAALTLPFLRVALDRGRARDIATVQVVHNNAYQGRVSTENFALTGLPPELLHPSGMEAWGSFCLLKAGLNWADRIVAVSPTYAREIMAPAHGEGLDGVYRARAHRVTGIRNGIDVERFNPRDDAALTSTFDENNLDGKRRCRADVLRELSLDAPVDGMFLAAIGRFATQKGWDVIAHAIPSLLDEGATVAILGDGDPSLARALSDLATLHPGRVVCRFGFDAHLARRMYAGADVMLVPSRFEPCGLVQLLAQRYGTVPVAHATGGLIDTIDDPLFDKTTLTRIVDDASKVARSDVRISTLSTSKKKSRTTSSKKNAAAPPSNATAREDIASTRARQSGVLFSPLTTPTFVEAVLRVRALAQAGTLDDVRRSLLQHDVSFREPAAEWDTMLHDVVKEARAHRR